MTLEEKAKKAEGYKEIFERNMAERDFIDADDGTRFKIGNDDEWKQAFSPDDSTRTIYPEWLFVRKDGLCISVYKGDVKVTGKYRSNIADRQNVKFFYDMGEGAAKMKNVEVHNLVALLFGSDVFGETANKRLADEGVFAFGVGMEDVQGHHKDDDHANNNATNILLTTHEVHDMITRSAESKNEEEYMKQLGRVLETENPCRASVLYTGEAYDRRTRRPIRSDKTVQPVQGTIYADEQMVNLISSIYSVLTNSDDEPVNGGTSTGETM